MSILNIINEKQKQGAGLALPMTVLPMDESQKEVIKKAHKCNMLAITGAAGTGKSQTIINLIIDCLCHNKTVLFVSKSEQAVNVIYERLMSFNIDCLAVQGGNKAFNVKLANKLLDIIDGKVNIEHDNGNIAKAILFDDVLGLLKTKRAKAISQLRIEHRKTLLTVAKAILENNKNKKQKVFDEIDFEPIIKALPVWCCNVNDISNSLPLVENMFDVLVCDETSQMDIASAIPCMFRAKEKAFFFGDEKQLKHLSFLDKNKEQSFATKHQVSADLQLVWRYRTNSLFDFASYYADDSILLRTHYRSPENLFKFSNDNFYNGAIKCAKKSDSAALEKVFINWAMTEEGKNVNIKEAEKAVEIIKGIIEECKGQGIVKSIGVIIPFAKQVELVQKMISEEIDYNDIVKYEIVASTVFSFQGAEKDYIIFCTTYCDNSPRQMLTFLENPNHFNVSISRAREKQFVLYNTENLKGGLLEQYIASIK